MNLKWEDAARIALAKIGKDSDVPTIMNEIKHLGLRKSYGDTPVRSLRNAIRIRLEDFDHAEGKEPKWFVQNFEGCYRLNTLGRSSVPEPYFHLTVGQKSSCANALSPEEITGDSSISEGARKPIIVNRYERDPRARQRCISKHGYKCFACSVLLEDIYGPLASKFVEVHHTTPLYEVGEKHEVSPENDLVPVCPNCHAIIHRREPMLSIDELKELIVCRNVER